MCLCRVLQMLKCVEQTFLRHALSVSDAAAHVNQHAAYLVVSTAEKARRGVACDGRVTQSRVDTQSALRLAAECVGGGPAAAAGSARRAAARVCLSLAAQNR